MNVSSFLRIPWLLLAAALVVLALGVAFAPLAAALGVLALAAASVLVWRFGAARGLWFLLLASIPLREPLSIDIVGTVSLFPTDLLLFSLAVAAVARDGIRPAWRESPAFRIGLLIVLLALPGLVTASRLLWGVNAVYRLLAQVAMLLLARSMVRSGRDAAAALTAVVAGLAPVIIYGFQQAFLPYGAELPDWSQHYTAWDALGRKTVRIFSTFRHPLHLSHYLSVGLGLSLGLASSPVRKGARWFLLAVGGAGAICNLFTSSIGGLIGMSAGVLTTLVLQRRRRIVLLAPVFLVALLLFAPPAIRTKLGRVVAGQATTGAARLVTYNQALSVLWDRPVLGVGWGSVRSTLEYEYRVTRAEAVAFTAENYFLQRGVAMGVPGLALAVILCILFFRNAVRPRGELPDPSWPRFAVLTAGIVFYAQAQSFPATYLCGNLVLWLLFAIAERMREDALSRKGVAP
jgi:O-antigen ligase